MAKNTHQIIINSALCIGCGLCAKDCVSGNIAVKDGTASVLRRSCIFCGHCEAICPKNAVRITGFDEAPQELEQVRLDPEQLMQAIRTRRSIRSFRPDHISTDIIRQIIEAGRQAPTGANSQSTGFVVLDQRKDEMEALAVGLARSVSRAAKPLMALLGNMNIDDQFFFKGAPLAIVITGDKVNASLAAENMAFMAEANGLGVLYSGFFTICANNGRKLRSALGLKHGQKVVTTLVIGYPAVKYHRTVRREPAKATWL